MSIEFRAAGAVTNGASGNVTPVLPTGWQVDDIHICLIASLDNVASTMPAGWTAIDAGTNNTAGLRITAFYRRAVSGDGNPLVTHTAGAGISAVIAGYRGVNNTGDPRNITGTTVSNTASATLTFHATGITTTVPNTVVVELGAIAGNQTSATYTGAPTPTERVDGPAAASRPEVVVADFLQAAAGSTSSRASTKSSATLVSSGILIALTPLMLSQIEKKTRGLNRGIF